MRRWSRSTVGRSETITISTSHCCWSDCSPLAFLAWLHIMERSLSTCIKMTCWWPVYSTALVLCVRACEIAQRLERERTDRKVRGSNPASASRLPLSRLGQPGSIPTLVLPSGGMTARHRKGATAERLSIDCRACIL
ncbi:hypothetical protein CSKR_103724 [Clonorchis sinensis]|uniref:Uncharacterized protein n=1 Tax=Clonorchis sinensis TaxID=79923 RepID=A0A3R7JZH0_CLOSI|nr:hypothetical protein CSKR_103724 [Clonorchis sinensis]